MVNSIKNIWFPFGELNTATKEASHKLFCFHHAGGNAAVFKPWISNQKGLAIYAVELPGKATRMQETPKTHYEKVVPEIAAAIETELGGSSFSLFGHSMGAVLAFKTAYFLETKFNRKPAKLIVAGRHAPQDEFKDPYQTYMGDDKLVEELKRVNGTPEEVFANAELLDLLLPSIKNDYKLNESFDYKGEVLNVPIVAHVSSDDPDASFEQMERWKLVTNQEFEITEFEGDHFFVYSLGDRYSDEVAEIVLNTEENIN